MNALVESLLSLSWVYICEALCVWAEGKTRRRREAKGGYRVEEKKNPTCVLYYRFVALMHLWLSHQQRALIFSRVVWCCTLYTTPDVLDGGNRLTHFALIFSLAGNSQLGKIANLSDVRFRARIDMRWVRIHSIYVQHAEVNQIPYALLPCTIIIALARVKFIYTEASLYVIHLKCDIIIFKHSPLCKNNKLLFFSSSDKILHSFSKKLFAYKKYIFWKKTLFCVYLCWQKSKYFSARPIICAPSESCVQRLSLTALSLSKIDNTSRSSISEKRLYASQTLRVVCIYSWWCGWCKKGHSCP